MPVIWATKAPFVKRAAKMPFYVRDCLPACLDGSSSLTF